MYVCIGYYLLAVPYDILLWGILLVFLKFAIFNNNYLSYNIYIMSSLWTKHSRKEQKGDEFT